MSIVSLALDRTSGATAMDIVIGSMVEEVSRTDSKQLCQTSRNFHVAGCLDRLPNYMSRGFSPGKEKCSTQRILGPNCRQK